MITHGRNADAANRSLDLDNRVSLAVKVGWASLAAGTEVGIMADSTLVTVTLDVVALVLAERAITVDTAVSLLASKHGVRNRIVDRHKAVTFVNERSTLEASTAVVPIWAVEALVADTENEIVTAIADGLMSDVAAWLEHFCHTILHTGRQGLSGWSEGVLWVVTVLIGNMALNAEIKVWAVIAGNEAVFSSLDETRVAGPNPLLDRFGLLLRLWSGLILLWNKCGFRVVGWNLSWRELLGRAADDLSVLDITLDHPVVVALTGLTAVHTLWAEIVVAIIAGAAVVMLVWNWSAALVAVNGVVVHG